MSGVFLRLVTRRSILVYMKLTKFEHACFTLEKDGQSLVFDPGNWSQDFTAPEHTVAIILSHEHADHFEPQLLNDSISKNPNAVVVAPIEMADKLAGLPVKEVTPGETLTIGPFDLEFFGGHHAVIHPSLMSVANIGVLVNESFYYPGDSFAKPDVPVKTLALPVTAPWLKVSESIDFMLEVQPGFTFPVHDHIASPDGKTLVDHLISNFAEQNGIRYQRVSRSIELAD